MTSFRKSLQATLNFQKSDEICQFEWGYWPETIERWRREGMPAGQEPWEAAGITFYHRVPARERIFPPFEPKVISRSGDNMVVQDENGNIKEISAVTTNFPKFLRHPVHTMADFDALRPRLDAATPGRFPDNWKQACGELAHRDSILVLGSCEISFFGWPRDLMGVENLLMAYYEQPDLIHAINRQHVEFLKAFYGRIMKDVAFDFIFVWEDMSYKNGPLISPDMFREFMTPYYKELLPFLKKGSGCKVLLDSDGDVTKLIPLFIEGGVDGLLPFECAAGMDIVEIARQYPDLIIAGGIDKREIAKGRKAIDAELEKKLPYMFKRGGYMPGMDHHVPPEVGYEDFLYYLRRVREIYG